MNHNSIIEHCLDTLQTLLGHQPKELPLHEPLFAGNEWQYVKSCLDSGWVSSVGEYVTLFEKKIAEFTGIPYVVVVVNGTAALHTALVLAQVQPGDEVLVPSLTFVATANAVAYCGATPHFVDCNETDLGIDVAKLDHTLSELTIIKDGVCINKNTLKPIRAIIPVHIFGHPMDLNALQALCEKYHLALIEDASESLGSYYKNKHTGQFGKIGVLSFNGNKIITTGGGGALLFTDKALAARAKHLTTTAKIAHPSDFVHDEVGYNYRLPNINAALGCAQIEQLPKFIENKRQLAKDYIKAFSDRNDLYIFQEPPETKSNYWLNALILREPNKALINEFIASAKKRDYGLRGLWTPLDSLPMYQHCPKMDLATTYNMFNRTICLPSGPAIGGLL